MTAEQTENSFPQCSGISSGLVVAGTTANRQLPWPHSGPRCSGRCPTAAACIWFSLVVIAVIVIPIPLTSPIEAGMAMIMPITARSSGLCSYSLQQVGVRVYFCRAFRACEHHVRQ